MRELESLLPELAPPAGGLARLQQGVASSRRPAARVRPRWAIAIAVCAVAVITVATLPPWIARRQQTEAIVQALRPVAASPSNDITVANGAAIELPSGQAGVRLYLVQTVQSADPGR